MTLSQKILIFALTHLPLVAVGATHGAAAGPSCEAVHSTDKKFDSPGISPTELIHLVKASSFGRSYRAEFRGQRIFIKIARTLDAAKKEGDWLQVLNRLNLGPIFYGLTTIDNKPSLVMEDVVGVNTQFAMAAPHGFSLSLGVVEEMHRQVEVLFATDIWPVDLQFLVTSERRVVMVDPELFEINGGRHPQKNFDGALRLLLTQWKLEDRIGDDALIIFAKLK